MNYSVIFGLVFIQIVSSTLVQTALDPNLFDEVLDPELCQKQVQYILRDINLGLRFIDAGYRTPKGILAGNSVDLGNYDQCLGITQNLEDSVLQGKYCMIRVPLNQAVNIPSFGMSSLTIDSKGLLNSEALTHIFRNLSRLPPNNPLSTTTLRYAVCIPKPCSTEQAITSLLFNLTAIGFKYEDDFCRLPNDKPWVPVDYISVIIFSVIGLLTVLSTCYDIIYTFILKTDPKTANDNLKIFSIYTNGRRLMTFTSASGSLECLDGIRCLAMMWVVVGHTFMTENHIANSLDLFMWYTSFEALWITASPITVDTFFALAGILLVYTTVGKLSNMNLLKNLHMFYLHRLLRMFPVLATVILLQASVLNRALDGPSWSTVAMDTNRCRTYWWTTLLHVQNFVNPDNMCINHSWYIAIDIHLHIVSPLILFWVVNDNKRTAWISLVLGLLASLTAATIYNVIMEFPPSSVTISRPGETTFYMHKYYFNTLTRASPFFVGMLFGYLLHTCRNKKIHINNILVIMLWIISLSLITFLIYIIYPTQQFDWNNQTINDLMNSFMRPAWALSLGWIIFACVHDYGGPVNWFLTLDIWKLPSRLSYATFMLHYPLMFTVNGTSRAPVYFSVSSFTFKFVSHFMLSIILAFIITLTIDAPFSTIVKKCLGGNFKNKQQTQKTSTKNEVDKENDAPTGNSIQKENTLVNNADSKEEKSDGIVLPQNTQ